MPPETATAPAPHPAAPAVLAFLRRAPWPQSLIDIAEGIDSREFAGVGLAADALRELVASGAVNIVPENGVSHYEAAYRPPSTAIAAQRDALIDRIAAGMAQEDEGARNCGEVFDGQG